MSAWFARLGEPLTDAERQLVRAYLTGLGLEREFAIETVTDFQSAARIIAHPDWDRRWWEAEQRERERLRTELMTAEASSQLLQALSRSVDDSLRAEQGTDVAPLAALGCTDEGLNRAAAGALGETLYSSRLAELANAAPMHPFSSKRAIFAMGHWPLVMLGGCFYVF
ncbi:MAG TPA: hypothetical protein VER96_34715 [Polyangiaceae bacterium]|nr:hypothetical protein [Polyangiaceae bacterium]